MQEKRASKFFVKEEMLQIKLLVLGSSLIFLGVMLMLHFIGVWQSQDFLTIMWPCLFIAPAYIHIKQYGRELGNVLIIVNSTLLLLYTMKLLNQTLFLGSTGGITLVILGIWVLKKAN